MSYFPTYSTAAQRAERIKTHSSRPSVDMVAIRRGAKIIEIENRVRIDELREQIKLHSGPGSFQYRMALRAELIKLYAQYR